MINNELLEEFEVSHFPLQDMKLRVIKLCTQGMGYIDKAYNSNVYSHKKMLKPKFNPTSI